MQKTQKVMRVRAKQLGYYGTRRREGEVFFLKERKGKKRDMTTQKDEEIIISCEDQFSDKWMERWDAKAQKAAKKREEEELEQQMLEEEAALMGEPDNEEDVI